MLHFGRVENGTGVDDPGDQAAEERVAEADGGGVCRGQLPCRDDDDGTAEERGELGSEIDALGALRHLPDPLEGGGIGAVAVDEASSGGGDANLESLFELGSLRPGGERPVLGVDDDRSTGQFVEHGVQRRGDLSGVGDVDRAACEGGELVFVHPDHRGADGEPFEITNEILQRSITVYDPARSITELGGSEQTEDEVIVLEADILFASNAWDLSDGAAARIVELAAEIPEGATVQVGGHTDSLPVDRSKYDFDNQQLSENRAQAVADALAAERPDLTLEVTGHGDAKPSAAGGGGHEASNAADRRVELRYGD